MWSGGCGKGGRPLGHNTSRRTYDHFSLSVRGSTTDKASVIAGLLLFFVAVAAALWLGSILIGATAAGVIGFFLVMLWLWRQE